MAGCLPVTKGIVVISLTPFSGCGLALLDRLPTMPEHNSLCGATSVWCEGSLWGVARVHGLGRNLRICSLGIR